MRALGRRAIAIATGLGLVAGVALAQPIDPRRPLTLRVGAPEGASPTDRVDPGRRGLVRQGLPVGALHVTWRKALGQALESAPLVIEGGDIALVAGRSDLVVLRADGEERSRTSIGAAAASPPTATSDGTVVVVTSGGDAIGVRAGAIRFRAHVGDRGAFSRAAPLPLDDGGAVVASGDELVALDARGGVRARASLSEVVVASPLATRGRVLALTSSGAVHAWTPGRDPERLGSLGGLADGGGALADENTLLAVVDGTRLVAFDLTHRTTSTRSTANGGLYLGPPATRNGTAEILSMTPGRSFLLGVRASGEEAHRILLPGAALTAPPDGGAPTLVVGPHVGPLVDRTGAIAFATPDGHVGVVSAEGATELLADLPCARVWGTGRGEAPSGAGASGTGIVALVPSRPGGMIVACDSGTVVAIDGT